MPDDLIEKILNNDKNLESISEDEWLAIERSQGTKIYSDLFFSLTRQKVEGELAKTYWRNVTDHHAYLSSALNRQVGIRVALCDYIININPLVDSPIIIDVNKFLQQERHAFVDELTGLFNRRYFNQIIHQEVRNSVRFKEPFSLLMIDIDNFKQYNDTFGHQAGDKLLSDLSTLMCYTAREIDHVVRYGGEEFAIILPRVDKEYAERVAWRHKEAVEKHDFEYEPSLPAGKVTISIGVASFPSDAADATELVARADQSLYRAKKLGRNMVCLWGCENRRFPRFIFDGVISLNPLDGQDSSKLAKGHDISIGGMKIEYCQPMRINQELEILLHEREGNFGIKLFGSPVWVQKDAETEGLYYLGLSFRIGSKDEEEALLDFMRSCTPQEVAEPQAGSEQSLYR